MNLLQKREELEQFAKNIIKIAFEIDSEGDIIQGLRRLCMSNKLEDLIKRLEEINKEIILFQAQISNLDKHNKEVKLLQEEVEKLRILTEEFLNEIKYGNTDKFAERLERLEKFFNLIYDLNKGLQSNKAINQEVRQLIKYRKSSRVRSLLLVALLSASAIYFSGCAAIQNLVPMNPPEITETSDYNIQQNQDKLKSIIEDKFGYLKHLKDNEYIVPDDVFIAYAETVSVAKPFDQDIKVPPEAHYIKQSYLDTNQKRENFVFRLKKLKLSDYDINIYYAIFNTEKIIVLRFSVFKSGFIKISLPHERIHYEIDKLSESELKVIREAEEELIKTRIDFTKAKDEGLLTESEIESHESYKEIARKNPRSAELINSMKAIEVKSPKGFREISISQNWTEFYCYLATGDIYDRAEKLLQRSYPEAYRIFIEMKAKAYQGMR